MNKREELEEARKRFEAIQAGFVEPATMQPEAATSAQMKPVTLPPSMGMKPVTPDEPIEHNKPDIVGEAPPRVEGLIGVGTENPLPGIEKKIDPTLETVDSKPEPLPETKQPKHGRVKNAQGKLVFAKGNQGGPGRRPRAKDAWKDLGFWFDIVTDNVERLVKPEEKIRHAFRAIEMLLPKWNGTVAAGTAENGGVEQTAKLLQEVMGGQPSARTESVPAPERRSDDPGPSAGRMADGCPQPPPSELPESGPRGVDGGSDLGA